MSTGRTADEQLLLGEWACLGILCSAPTHGFAVAARLKPTGDIGRVWSLSRALTYRSLEQLANRGYIRPVSEEPGIAGGMRTILAPTRVGRARLRRWLHTPVEHLRDVRSGLLLKLVIADACAIDIGAMLGEQRARVADLAAAIDAQIDAQLAARIAVGPENAPRDVVMLWRSESSKAVLRFLDRVAR